MTTVRYHLTKAGPRLLDLLVDSPQIDCTVTGPGMLIQAFKLLTDRDVVSGCDAQFYHSVANDLEGTSFCGNRPPSAVAVRVERHRLGPELTIAVGPVSMYQALIRLRTVSGRTFRELVLESMAGAPPEQMIAVLCAVRASSHHEHHASAMRAVVGGNLHQAEHRRSPARARAPSTPPGRVRGSRERRAAPPRCLLGLWND